MVPSVFSIPTLASTEVTTAKQKSEIDELNSHKLNLVGETPVRLNERLPPAMHKNTLYVQWLSYFLVKGSVCFIEKFALTPFSSPLPSGVQISKQNMD